MIHHDGFTPISSGHMDGAKYDSFEKQLTIRFQNGSHYVVHGVLPRDYEEFMSAPSQGAYYHAVLKQNHEIERVK
jgi:hypothetical protein